MPFAVNETHVLVPRSVRGTLAVSFDDAYVWSFTTPRDGTWTPAGWRVPWPEALRPFLVGSTVVGLDEGERRRFQTEVCFGGESRPLSLRDRHGHRLAVDKVGHLTRVFSETGDDIRGQIVEGTRKALADLRSNGFEAHLSYGCLLGAVRDGRMIGHDSDADLAYLSRYTTPAQVIVESYAMERVMRRLGWHVVRMSGADLKLLYALPDGRVVHIDIFGAFHVGDTFYQLGGRSGVLPRSALVPATTITLEGVELPAPADPEAVLGFLYGPSWRTPDPAFQNVDPPEGLVRLDGWLRGVRDDLVPWNEFYRAHRGDVPLPPSDFAHWVADRVPATAPVADLGCGTGRDASWFTSTGRLAFGYDFSGAAVRQTRRRMVRAGGDPGAARTIALNDLRSVLVAGAELSRTEEPVHLYARELVGCLNDEGLDHLGLLASMALRRGGSLMLEFSTGTGPAPEPAHLVRRVDVDRVVAHLSARGGIVEEVIVEPGLDFYDRPEPHTARVVARWTHPTGTRPAREEPT